MILTIDIGNSNICFGVYEGKNALFTARAKTDPMYHRGCMQYQNHHHMR